LKSKNNSFYDDWVARDINGKHLNRIYPYFHDKKSLKNFLSPTFTQKRILISAAASASS
jgi:hypothetical protein